MLQPSGSDVPETEPAAPARLKSDAREGIELAIESDWRVGKKLEAAREQRGLTLEQVAAQTKVRREFIEALEEMNAKLLPGKAYALAYLKSYARLLGLDPAEIADQFQREVALSREDATPQVRDPKSRPRGVARPWLPAMALGLIAAGFVAWQALKDNFITAGPSTEAVAAPMRMEPRAPTAAPTPASQGQIEIRAVAAGHLEVRGPDGTIYLYRTLQPGDVYRPDPGPGWTLHARDGGAFDLTVDGSPAGLLGEPGKPVLGRRLDSIAPLDVAVVPAPVTPAT
ncbi:MAG: helix-turn-helix domain-containing protein [Hyphomonadaceae bacterium]|nr:helix-turn-helix domain-containing protein [Hyphomonadaceae bacterium]